MITSICRNFTFLLLFLSFINCSQEVQETLPTSGTVSLNLNQLVGTPASRVEEGDTVAISHVVLTILKANGDSTAYNQKKLKVTVVGDSYLCENIILPIGSYQITTLYMVDVDENVLLATPLKALFEGISDLLPIPFEITSLQPVNDINVEVISIEGFTPEDFGLENLNVKFKQLFYFFLGLLDEEENLEFLSGRLKLTGEDLETELQLNNVINKVTPSIELDQYTIAINKEGYEPFESNFTYDSLMLHKETPLLIPLKKELEEEPVGGTFIGDVFLTTQSDVNEFRKLAYEIIEGRVRIGEYFPGEEDPILDLSPLASIIEITSSLEILTNKKLTSLTGLHNLESVLGYLTISNNTLLQSLEGLSRLRVVASELRISKNATLVNLKGLENLTKLVSNTIIEHNYSLIDLTGLDNIKSVGYLHFAHNSAFESFAGLHNLETIGGMTIAANNSLSSLEGFGETLTKINHLYITDNAKLNDLNGLLATDGVLDGSMRIINNQSLESLEGLKFKSEITFAVEVKGNPLLTDISAMNAINEVGRDLTISENETLENLDGLSNLFSVGNLYNSDNGYVLTITNNKSLVDFCGLTYLFKEGIYYKLNLALNGYNPTASQIKEGECSLEAED